MSSSRQVMDAMLAGRTDGRPAWLPLMNVLPARLSQASYREMTCDPGLWAAGLVTAAEFLQADGIVVGLEPALVAEACGASLDWSATLPRLDVAPPVMASQPLAAPRLMAMLEALNRLGATARSRFGLVAVLPGPGSLARQLCPDQPLAEGLRQVKKVLMEVAEATLKTRPDLLLLQEVLVAGTEPDSAWPRAFGTLRNLAAHYDVPLAVRVEGWDSSCAPWLTGLNMAAYVLGNGNGDALALAGQLTARRAAVGLPVPVAVAGDAPAMVAAAQAARSQGCNLFLTTVDAVGSEGDLAELRGLAAGLAVAA